MYRLFLLLCSIEVVQSDIATEEIHFLNELPIDKLLRLKNSLQEIVTTEYRPLTNITTTPATHFQSFGAVAQALRAPPLRKSDYDDDGWQKHGESSKISNIFSMSVTTLAFLAFGGYLLCLIVQAIKAKQMFYNTSTTAQPATFFVSAGIKKRPQTQFSAYGRRRRDDTEARSLQQIDLPPEELFSALLQLCEGYAKWSERYGDTMGHWIFCRYLLNNWHWSYLFSDLEKGGRYVGVVSFFVHLISDVSFLWYEFNVMD